MRNLREGLRYVYFKKYLAKFLTEWEKFQSKIIEKDTFVFNKFFPKIVPFMS